MRGKLSAILIFIVSMVATGCAHRSRPENQGQLTYVSKPVIDFGRGGGGLRIDGFKQFHSAAELLQGLTQGYRSRIEMPKDRDAITIDGQFPRLDLLRIDLTNGALKKDFRPHQFKKPSAPQPTVLTKQFEYVARPLRYEGGVIEMHITARDAEMSLIRDGDQASLVLAGFIDDAMKKHNGKVMPLAQWPGNKIHLSNAQIQIDDHIRIKAGFGPTPTLAKN